MRQHQLVDIAAVCLTLAVVTLGGGHDRLLAQVPAFLLLWLVLRSPYRRLDQWRLETTPGDADHEAAHR